MGFNICPINLLITLLRQILNEVNLRINLFQFVFEIIVWFTFLKTPEYYLNEILLNNETINSQNNLLYNS